MLFDHRADAVPRHDDEEAEIHRMPGGWQNPDLGRQPCVDDGADSVQAQQIFEWRAYEGVCPHLCDNRLTLLRCQFVARLPAISAVMAVLEPPALLRVARDRIILADARVGEGTEVRQVGI